MRRILLSLLLVVSAAIAAAPGPNPATGGVRAPAPTRTLTGLLGERIFIQPCGCYHWVITKNNRDSEMDIAAVQAQASALNGSRVRATGMWATYIRDGRRIPYMIVTRLDPA